MKIGVTLAVFQRLGNTFNEKERLINFAIEGAINGVANLNIRELISSIPVDLLESIFKR